MIIHIDNNKTYHTLMDLYHKNPDGFTVYLKNGKVTSKIFKRYVVAYKTIIEIHDYYIVFNGKLKDTSYYGGWYDKEDNKYIIENVKLYNNLKYALKIAKKYKQKYIYDLKENKEIKV